ncbi:MAG: hypothetical protein E7452_05715 [Ruminococcaceae bacterium]|nr:hypothetical protein [Oscillospiraceae bacterium]
MNLLFPKLPTPKMHPANIGHDLERDGGPLSERLWAMYRDRVLCLTMFEGDLKNVMDDLYTVFLTGAKIVSAAAAPKTMGPWEAERLKTVKFYIDLAHSLDPELIFDVCLSDQMTPTAALVQVPAEAFAAFGLPVEERPFDAEKCDDPTERKLWLYARAKMYRDAGFESLTLGADTPVEVVEKLKTITPIVSVGAMAAAAEDPCVTDPVAIAEKWIAQKQKEQ